AEWKPGREFNKWMMTMQKDFIPSTREFVKGMFPDSADPALVERMATQMSMMRPDIGMAVLRAIFSYDKAAALVRRSGHFPMMEKPKKFNRLLGRAIDDLAP